MELLNFKRRQIFVKVIKETTKDRCWMNHKFLIPLHFKWAIGNSIKNDDYDYYFNIK